MSHSLIRAVTIIYPRSSRGRAQTGSTPVWPCRGRDPVDPAGVGAKKCFRGQYPAGVGVEKKKLGSWPRRGRGQKYFTWSWPAGVGVKKNSEVRTSPGSTLTPGRPCLTVFSFCYMIGEQNLRFRFSIGCAPLWKSIPRKTVLYLFRKLQLIFFYVILTSERYLSFHLESGIHLFLGRLPLYLEG